MIELFSVLFFLSIFSGICYLVDELPNIIKKLRYKKQLKDYERRYYNGKN